MSTEIHYKPPERSPLQRLIALLLNQWFWWKLFQKILKFLFPAFYPVAKLYHPALDAKLISLDGKNEFSLLNDYVKKMPPHMPLIVHMESSDGQGALNSTKPVKNHHRNIEERVAAANRMIRETGWKAGEVICDSMKNEALERYEAFPERLLIIQDGIVVHEGGKGPIVMVRYDPKDVSKWLESADTRSESERQFYALDKEEVQAPVAPVEPAVVDECAGG